MVTVSFSYIIVIIRILITNNTTINLTFSTDPVGLPTTAVVTPPAVHLQTVHLLGGYHHSFGRLPDLGVLQVAQLGLFHIHCVYIREDNLGQVAVLVGADIFEGITETLCLFFPLAFSSTVQEGFALPRLLQSRVPAY